MVRCMDSVGNMSLHIKCFLIRRRFANSFVVHNRKEFVRLIMPVYFRMSKFASFQRQLNLYDYKRITAGLDKGGKLLP
jgi:hypothetical protein